MPWLRSRSDLDARAAKASGGLARSRRLPRSFAVVLLVGLAPAALSKDLAAEDFPSSPARRATPLLRGSEQAWRDFTYHYWDPDAERPRIRPTGFDGKIRNEAPYPTFWHMVEANNVLFWRWKATRSPAVAEMIRSQFAEIRTRYPDARLTSAAWSGYRVDGIVNVADDAAWAIAYFCQVHEATGDPAALRIAEQLIDSTYATFADPNQGGAGYLYALPGQDPDHQGVSTGHEAVVARCCVYVFEQISHGHLLAHAERSWAWMQEHLRHPSGVYFAELDIRPTLAGKPNPSYRKPIGWERPGDIQRGGSVAFLGGTMAMASLSAALYMQSGEARYLEEVRGIVAGMTRRDTFLRPGAPVGVAEDVLVNERDGWANGFAAPYLVDDALTLDGVDEDGRLKSALVGTALAITRARTKDGFYGADWSGPEWDAAHRWKTWIEQAAGGTGSGRGMALPEQLPTTASSIAMVLAGARVEGWARPR